MKPERLPLFSALCRFLFFPFIFLTLYCLGLEADIKLADIQRTALSMETYQWAQQFFLYNAGRVLLFVIKVFVYSVFCGAFADIVSGREYYLNQFLLRGNGKKYFIAFAVFFGLKYSASRLLLQHLHMPGVHSSVSVALIFLTAFYVCRTKTEKQIRIHGNDPAGFWISICGVLICLFFSELILIPVPELFFKNPYVYRILLTFYFFLEMTAFAAAVRFYSIHIVPEKKEKTLFLISPLWQGISGVSGMIFYVYPPFFTVLRALTPSDYDIVEFNGVFWRKTYAVKGAIAAVSCFTTNSSEAYKTAKQLRARGMTVVMGGPHVTYNTEEALHFCDAVVVGEAESVWKQVIADHENGELKKIYTGQGPENFTEEIQPLLLSQPEHVSAQYIETTRGCKYNCDFCSIPSLSKKKIRHRPVKDVIEQLKYIRNKYKKFVFIDNNIYADPQYSSLLFEAMEPLGMSWYASCSIDAAYNEKTLRLMKQSGCHCLLIGYEILSTSEEKKKGGKYAFARDYLRLSRNIQKHGIKINARFIFGFDGDRIFDLLRLFIFAFRLNPFIVGTTLLTPLPGTAFFDRIADRKRIRTLNWERYTLHDQVIDHPVYSAALIQAAYYIFFAANCFLASSRGRIYLAGIIMFIYFL